MADPRNDISDNLETVFNKITVANGYDTDVQHVTNGVIVQRKDYDDKSRQALIQYRYSRQTNERSGDQDLNRASVIYLCYASMTNITANSFMLFLGDIEHALAVDPTRDNAQGEAYKVRDTYISSIELTSGTDFDEILDLISKKHSELTAIINITVIYDYVPYTI